MPKVMVTIRSPREILTLSEVISRYGLTENEIDAKFGVIEIDPRKHAYTVLIDESATQKLHSIDDWVVEGVFSNPRIAAFGSSE